MHAKRLHQCTCQLSKYYAEDNGIVGGYGRMMFFGPLKKHINVIADLF